MARKTKIPGLALLCGVMLLLPLGYLYLLAKQQRGLDLEISLDDKIFYLGDPIVMILHVENISDHDMEVAGWPEVDFDDCHLLVSQALELELYYGKIKKPQKLTDPLDLRPATRRTSLPPGGKIVFRCDVVRIFGIARPGKYILKGTYVENGWPERAARRWFGYWSGRVSVQDSVSFEVQNYATDR